LDCKSSRQAVAGNWEGRGYLKCKREGERDYGRCMERMEKRKNRKGDDMRVFSKKLKYKSGKNKRKKRENKTEIK